MMIQTGWKIALIIYSDTDTVIELLETELIKAKREKRT